MAKCVYLRDSPSIKFDVMNCHYANLVFGQLYFAIFGKLANIKQFDSQTV